MNEFTVKLAGVPIGVEAHFDDVYRLCGEYLCEDNPAFTVRPSLEDIALEQEKSDREASFEGLRAMKFSDGYLETLAVYRQIAHKLLDYDVMLMHGSAVCVDGKAYLFTAASGTGKTTHTRLWLREIPGAFVINGDKPLIRFYRDRCEIFGTPWSGKEGMNRNTSAPLKAVCVLERGKTNQIRREDFSSVLPMVIQQSYRPQEVEGMTKTLDLIRRMSTLTSFYRLSCNMDPDAATTAYRGMNEG
ncbi:MAG: hypothetical protein J6Z79_01920 [Clostridia bacterium]|nr:hypothetical protein [Clostridia bacterium]